MFSQDWIPTNLNLVPTQALRIVPSQDDQGFVQIHDFRVDDEVLSFSKGVYSDTLDVAFFYQQENGEPMILAYQTVRLAPHIRELSDSESSIKIHHVLEWCLPATYLRLREGMTSVEGALDVLKGKLGVSVVGEPELLGSNYYPSVGCSMEYVTLRKQRVLPTEQIDSMKVGSGYEPVLRRKFFKLQEVVDQFFAGAIRDIRLLLATLRLAEDFGMQLAVNLNLPQPDWYGERTQSGLIAQCVPDLPSVCNQPERVERKAGRFMSKSIFEVQNCSGDGQDLGDPYVVELVDRTNPDSVDVFGYWIQDGKLFVSFHVGERPARLARHQFPIALSSSYSSLNVEPVARLLPPKAGLEIVAGIALDGLKGEAGLMSDSVSFLSPGLSPSPGVSTEKVYLAFVPLMGDSSSGAPALLEVDSLLKWCHTGVVQDLRLELGARLLKLHFNYSSSDTALASANTLLRREFSRVLGSTVRLPQLFVPHPELQQIHWKLSEDEIYRKQCIRAVNELGLSPLESDHPLDDGAFSPMLPRFAVPEVTDKRRLAFYLLHDMHHHLLGDVVPYVYDAQGLLKGVALEDYAALASAQECRAVWYSDVLIPHIIGFEKAREIFGSPSTAEAFDELGISKEEAHEIILSIERDGVIPQSLLRHAKFGKYKSLFVDRMLRYHFMDTEQIRLVYEFWIERPELVRHVLAFTDTHTASRDYIDSFEEVFDYLKDSRSPDGYNPLKEALSALRNTELRSLALRLAVYSDILHRLQPSQSDQAVAQIESCLATMKIAYDELGRRGRQVSNIESSELNFSAFVYAREVRMRLIPRCTALLEELEKTPEFLALEEFRTQVGRIFSFVPAVNQVIKEILPNDKLNARVAERYEELLSEA